MTAWIPTTTRCSLSIAATLLACADPPSTGPEKLDDTSGTSSIQKVDLGGGTSIASTADETAGAGPCDNPAFTCSEITPCGTCGPLDEFTPDGCLRRACDFDADCHDDERCFRPSRFNVCDEVVTESCADEAGGCVCTSKGGEPAFCVAASHYPPGPQVPCSHDCGAPGNHSSNQQGTCYCDDGWQWCDPSDPLDFTCCEPPG